MSWKICLAVRFLVVIAAFVFLGEQRASAVSITRTSATNHFYIDTSKTPHLTSAYVSYLIQNTDGVNYDNVWVKIDSFTGGSITLAASENGQSNLGPLANGEIKPVFFYLTAAAAMAMEQSHSIKVYHGHPSFGGSLVGTQTFSFRSVQETIAANANKVTIVVYGPEPPALGGIVTVEVIGETGTIGSSKVLSYSPAAYGDWRADSYDMVQSVVTLTGGNTGSYTNQLLVPVSNTTSTDYHAVYKFRAVGVTAAPTQVSPVAYISSGTQIKHTGTGNFGALPPITPAENFTTISMLATPTQLFETGGNVTFTLRANNAGTNDIFIDRFKNLLPPGATYVPGSSTYNGVAFEDPFALGQELNWVDLFAVPAGTTRDLVFQASFPYTVGSFTNSAVSYFESTQIDTTLDTTDDAPATQTIRIFGPNVAPVANDDATSTVENTDATFDVTANDTDSNDNIDPGTVNLNLGSATGSGTWSVDANGMVTFVPSADWTGTATIQYTVSDTGGLMSGSATLTVTVTLATPAPRLNAISNVTINEDFGTSIVNLSGITTGSGSSVVITATSSDPAVLGNPTVNYTSPNSTGSLTLTSIANAYGEATITVTAVRNGSGDNTTVRTFTVTVNPVNDVPTFTKGANLSIHLTAGAQTNIAWASSISAGPANEAAQNVSFIVSNNNNTLFSVQPSISPIGTLTYTPQGLNTGTATVTVQVQDNGGVANGGVNTSVTQTFTITVGSAGLIPATGGLTISATNAANAIPAGVWTRLSGPKYFEGAPGNVGLGTIILTAPAGFEFDTANTVTAPQPTVIIVRESGSGPTERNVNKVASGTAVALTSMSSTAMTLTITDVSSAQGSGSAICSLTWTNVRVRPLLGNPLRNGMITNSGTSTVIAVTPGVTSWGDLGMVAGPAAALQIVSQPSATANAGVNFVQQPVVRIVDAFGNWLYNDNTSVVTVARLSGSGVLQGTTTATVVNGEVKFSNLNHLVAGTINLQFTSPGLTSATSSNVIIGAGPAANLAIQTQPSATATAGIAFAQQPVIRIEDAYGNPISSTAPVTVVRNSGSGTLQGITTVDAVNGIASFIGLNHLVSGTINLQFSSPGLNTATSSNIVIGHGPAAQLSILTQPSSTASAGQDFAQQPVVRILDQFGNLVTSDNTTQVTASRGLGSGTLQGTTTVTASGGVVSFAGLDHLVAEVINLIFTSNTGLPPVNSSNVTIQPGAPFSLAIEAQPSGRATVNQIFPDQPVIIIVDSYGNWVDTDNSSVVTVARNAGSGTLAGTTTLTASEGIVNYSNLQHPTLGTITLLFTSPGLNSVTSQNVLLTPEITQLAFVTQPQNAAIDENIGNVTVELRNSSNAAVAFAGVPITIELASGSGLLSGTLSGVTDASGQVTFTGLSVSAIGTKVLEARSETLTATSSSFVISGRPPTLTAINALPGATEDNPFTITYATLIGAADEADPDGDPLCFRVGAINSGTLTKDGIAVVAGSTLLCAGDEWVWTPAANGNGSPVNAFTVTAFDGSEASATPVQVAVTVAPVNDAPTLTTIDPIPGAFENTPFVLTYDILADAGDEADIDGDAICFRVEAVTSGTLTKDGNPVVPGVTMVCTGEELVWTPDPSASGTLNAFTLAAWDGTVPSSTPVQVSVNVTPVDDPPTLGSISTLSGAFEDTAFTVSHAALLAASDAADPDSDPISFRVGTVTGGTLTKNGVPVVPGDTLLASGEEWVWTPALNDNGVLPAFTVVASDGDQFSAPATQVNVAVTEVNDIPGFTKGSDVAVNQDAGLQAYANWATSISTGPANESGQTVVFVVSNDNNGIFGTQPSVTSAGTLIFAPNGSSGTATITVQVQDNGGTANSGQNISGTQTFQVTFSEAGLSPATGGSAISADTTGGAWTTLSGPVYEENTPGDMGVGTFIINAPSGFEFDTGGVAPTVLITRDEGSGADSDNVNTVTSGTTVGMTSVSASQLVFTITSASQGTVECALTWQNVRVRPTSGSPLAAGNMFKTGTSTTFQVVDNLTSLGGLAMVPGVASALQIVSQPSATAVAGVDFAQQPVVQVIDQFGNLIANDNTTQVTVARKDGNGTLLGTTTLTVVGGIVAFQDLQHTVAGTITLEFTSAGLAPAESENVVISPAAASQLTLQTQPSATATAGEPFLQQPVIRVEDAFGNLVITDNTTEITVVRNAGAGTLLGNTTMTVIGGVATFAGLNHTLVGTIDLNFTSDTGLTPVTSSNVVIAHNIAVAMELTTQPSPSATAGVNFAQQPILRLVDAYGNTVSSDSTTEIVASRSSGSGTLQGTTTVPVSAGIATFSDLHHNVVETINLDFETSGLPTIVSDDIVISPAAANRLTIQIQPSSTATAGDAFAQQPVIRIEDEFGNPITTDNTTVVTVNIFSGSGTLQGTLTGTAINGIVTFTDLHHLVAGDITLEFTSPGLDAAVSDTVTIGAGTAMALGIVMQPSPTATAGALFAQQPVVRVVDAYGNTVISDNTSQITVARDDGFGTLQGTTIATVINGVATFTNLSHTVSGTIDLSFTSGVLTPAISDDIVISPGAATQLAFTEQPTPTMAGATITPAVSVQLQDAYNNPVLTSGVDITLALIAGSGPLNGTLTSATVNGLATFSDLSINITGIDKQLRASASGVSDEDSQVFNIFAGPATAVVMTGPSTVNAGEASNPFVLKVVDQYGNDTTVSQDTTFTLSSTSGGTVVFSPFSPLTITAGLGMIEFTYTDNASGTQTITATRASGDLVGSGTHNIDVLVTDYAVGIRFVQEPLLETAGELFLDQPIIETFDAFGAPTANISNLLPSDTLVTLSLIGGPGTLAGTLILDLASPTPGVITWSDLAESLAGTNWQLVASNTAFGSITSQIFTVVSPVPAPAPFGTNGLPNTVLADAGPIGLWLSNLRGDQYPWYTPGIGLLWRDLVVANYNSNAITVRLCKDDGTFENPVTYEAGLNPFAVRSGFFSDYTYEDIAVANFGTNTVSIFESVKNGSGQLLPKVDYQVGSTPNPGPIALSTAFASGSAYADLFVVNSNECTVSVLRNVSDAFVLETNIPVGLNPMSIHAVDIDGDSRKDIVTANQGDGTLTILRGEPNFRFVHWKTITLFPGGQPEPTYAQAGDINKDGLMDIVVANGGSNTVSILLQSSSQEFNVAANYNVGLNPRSLLLRDLNKDQKLDLAVANYAGATVDILMGKGDGSFERGGRITTGRNPLCVVGSNFNGDGTTDLAVSNYGDDTISLFLYSGPIANKVSVTTVQNQPVNVRLTGSLLNNTNIAYLVENAPANGVLSGTPPNLVYTPDANFVGTDTFQYRTFHTNYTGPESLQFPANTGSFNTNYASTPATVTITVKPVNQAPTFTLTTNRITVPSSAALQTVPGVATALSPGVDEEDQTLRFTVTTPNRAFFSVQPTLSTNGTLTFRPGASAAGTNVLEVRLLDDGPTVNGGQNSSVPQQLEIVVLPNAAPSFQLSSNLVTGQQFSPTQIVPNFATQISAGENEAGQTVTFIVTVTNTAFYSVRPAISSSGALTFAPSWSASGTNYVRVSLRDNGPLTGGGVNQSGDQVFAISVPSGPNPFTATKSLAYNGLFSDTNNGVAFHNAGYITLKVGSKMSYSGKLLVDGNAIGFSGKFESDGTSSTTTKSRLKSFDKPELTLNLALDVANGCDAVSGMISQGSTWTAHITADRQIWTTNLSQQATAYTNRYTMSMDGFANKSDGPVGKGYGSLLVNKLGRVTLSGSMGDGVLLKQSTVLAADGYWPFFSPGYKVARINAAGNKVIESKGFVLGWLNFDTNALGNMAPQGNLHWIKTGWTNSTYVNGFTNHNIGVLGSRWAIPAQMNMTNVISTFTDGDLGALFTANFVMQTNTALSISPGVVNENLARISSSPRNGVFKGYFVHPQTRNQTRYLGVLLQDSNLGRGYLMGPTESGTVLLNSAD